MKTPTLATAVALTSLLACTNDGQGEDLDGDGKADSGNSVSVDNLNGIWNTTIGSSHAADTSIEAWSAIGIRLHFGDKVYQLTRSGDKLTADGVALEIRPNQPGPRDDEIDGKIDGKTVKLLRDIELKPSIT